MTLVEYFDLRNWVFVVACIFKNNLNAFLYESNNNLCKLEKPMHSRSKKKLMPPLKGYTFANRKILMMNHFDITDISVIK